MKKFTTWTMTMILILSLAACGGKSRSVLYTLSQEKDGLKLTDVMKLDAKGDAVQKMEETITLDMSAFDEDTQKLMTEAYDSLAQSYQAVDGVECTGTVTDSVYTIKVMINAEGDTVAKLAEQGLLQVDGDPDGISLEKTGAALEKSGYKKAEQ